MPSPKPWEPRNTGSALKSYILIVVNVFFPLKSPTEKFYGTQLMPELKTVIPSHTVNLAKSLLLTSFSTQEINFWLLTFFLLSCI